MNNAEFLRDPEVLAIFDDNYQFEVRAPNKGVVGERIEIEMDVYNLNNNSLREYITLQLL